MTPVAETTPKDLKVNSFQSGLYTLLSLAIIAKQQISRYNDNQSAERKGEGEGEESADVEEK